ncbi:hypothetical protein RND81_10G025200 [Saponaria officinalis]|uniref:Receptor-like serine/threonine-protein kinase n=1 Tax=Saponaria officinalis TaxID=3572 RepID=A0AAW1HYC5_SAPOF
MHLSGLIFCFLCCSSAVFATTSDTLTSSDFLRDPQTIVSENNVFCLGFFSPVNSTRRYVGIWYNKASPPVTVVWVANRDVPLNDSYGQLQLSGNGNKLMILNGQKTVIWSSDLLSQRVLTAQLLDSGNLVLLSKSGAVIWQSFDHPTDTVLPNMKVTATKISGVIKPVLRSWASPSDPSNGRFTVGTDFLSLPQLITWDGDRPYWRSGPWSGNIFIGIQYNDDFTNTGWRLSYDSRDSVSMVYSYPNASLLSFYDINSHGSSFQKLWDYNTRSWEVLWQSPEGECFVYGKCGEFGYGTCLSQKGPMCQCFKGFVPKDKMEWKNGNWSKGCVRRTPLQCQSDGFIKHVTVKVPDHAELALGYDRDQRGGACLMDCSCLAYSYYSGIGCMLWNRSLIDTVELSGRGADLYLRLAVSELVGGTKAKITIIIGAAGIAIVTIIAVFISVIWKRRAQRRERNKMLLEILKGQSATNNFHESNKLGQGGLGPVYKGTLEDGEELAIKRLSRTSRQGVEEFMNEVLVISKLQHKNLVKLLGCCVERQERMLVYEYLPNKSLDAFIFDPEKKGILDWNKRYKIVEGICRGLLYLHRDSRLKIIHRDLKAANILLDENLNPKISDFGMARIFGGNQSQADTTRVSMQSKGASLKSQDVFSFGVFLLDIITGKKTQWYDEESLSLLGYVWKLWSEDNICPFINPVIADQGFQADILKSVQVGLLCVQEYAADRPDISSVISMLTAASTATFRQPKPPGFTRLMCTSENIGSQNNQRGSMNGLSNSTITCR